jgi:hypothetical protein
MIRCEEAVPELAWRSLRSPFRQTGERLANRDGVLLVDLLILHLWGEFRKRLRLFPGGWINLLKRGASGKKQDLQGIVTSLTLEDLGHEDSL